MGLPSHHVDDIVSTSAEAPAVVPVGALCLAQLRRCQAELTICLSSCRSSTWIASLCSGPRVRDQSGTKVTFQATYRIVYNVVQRAGKPPFRFRPATSGLSFLGIAKKGGHMQYIPALASRPAADASGLHSTLADAPSPTLFPGPSAQRDRTTLFLVLFGAAPHTVLHPCSMRSTCWGWATPIFTFSAHEDTRLAGLLFGTYKY